MMDSVDEVVKLYFPKEITEFNTASRSFEFLLERSGDISKISRNDAKMWVADSGLNIVSVSRKIRLFNAFCRHHNVASVLENVTFENLDFSNDLERHYFKTRDDMIECVLAGANAMGKYRDDIEDILCFIALLAWDGFTPSDMVAMNVGDITLTPINKRMVSASGKGIMSQKTHEFISDKLASVDPSLPVFRSVKNNIYGERWKSMGISEIVSRLNQSLESIGVDKEILTHKLAENGIYRRIHDEAAYRGSGDVKTIIQEIINVRPRTVYNLQRSYAHWEKYYQVTPAL